MSLPSNAGFLTIAKPIDLTPVQAGESPAGPDSLFAGVSEAPQDILFKKVYKLKKKYKRILTASSTLRMPVREVDGSSQNIYLKESYSKPWFLSHLHRFLFRLTPF